VTNVLAAFIVVGGTNLATTAFHAQVCVISIITSIVLFAVPLGGRCKKCDTQDPSHCVKGETTSRSRLPYRMHGACLLASHVQQP
jgi:hypothetical protein